MPAMVETASVRPVMMARAMMLWPMEYSLTPLTWAKAYMLS